MSTTENAPIPSPGSGGGERATRLLRLTVEYDGTGFAGFQLQDAGQRTVQGVLEAAIAKVSGEFCRVHAAGRTDAGVHATGQVVHFESKWTVPVEKLAVALNSGALPRDVTVREGRVAEAGFHARFSATSRTYCYTIVNRPQPSALLDRYALHVRDPLDRAAMRAAAVELNGTHDWAAFGVPNAPGDSTVRRMYRVDVRSEKECLRITVCGNAFLKHQVRAFVGTLVQVGLGRLSPDDVREIRRSRDRTRCTNTAPPHGLCLICVSYDGTRQRFEPQPESDVTRAGTEQE